jgi:hypothetical protein
VERLAERGTTIDRVLDELLRGFDAEARLTEAGLEAGDVAAVRARLADDSDEKLRVLT